MILSSRTIRELLGKGKLVVKPLEDQQIQPASIDLRLASEFLTVDTKKSMYLHVDKKAEYKKFNSDEIVIQPKSFILARTAEYVEIPEDHTAFIEGRSSIGRLGLFIENAGWIDPGFKGTLTLELFNANDVPIRIKAGTRICQMVIVELTDKPEKTYSGKYQGQINVTGSKIHLDWNLDREK